jgi:hypothetical protein
LEYQRRIQTEKDNNQQLLNTWKSSVNGHWNALSFVRVWKRR